MSGYSQAIPTRLQQLLERDRALDGAVRSTYALFDRVLDASRLPFFPEYTDHGMRHIEEVLGAAESLIDDRSFELLTASDAAALSLAVLLHDLGMHLDKEGFLLLIGGKWAVALDKGLGDKPWPMLWEEYRLEASRFSGPQNERLFGDPEPVAAPDTGTRDWSEKQHLLVGEFLRRHHPRLAHEIALQGLPATPPIRLEGDSLVKPALRSLAGFIARSHGMPLRAAADCLKPRFGQRMAPYNVHAVYLMALVRIADYLQLHSGRAEPMALRLRSLRSTVSRREWSKHHAVGYIRADEEDVDAVYVHLEPPGDVATYLAIESTLAGLQQELDQSWAVLGEVYGRDPRLHELALAHRRVKSNAREPHLLQELPYIPESASFRTSDAELLHLLVAPLYEFLPEYGIREMIQNSVDAVRELEAWCVHTGTPKGRLTLTEQEADVVVSVDHDGDAWQLTVTDRGIGMTASTIRDYFLRAGASFRSSDTWRKQFADQHGRSRVLRSGRFGVGALAAFLLGDEIQVSTRHAGDAEGLEFVARLETNPIELKRNRRPVGTTIRLKLRPDVGGRLREEALWDWYCLRHPSVLRRLEGKGLPQTLQFPSEEGPVPPEWCRFTASSGETITWEEENPDNDESTDTHIACNGIRVNRYGIRHWVFEYPWLFRFSRLSIFDRDGAFPLNLQRNRADLVEWRSRLELIEEMLKDFLALTLLRAPTHELSSSDETMSLLDSLQHAIEPKTDYRSRRSIWAATDRGLTLSTPWLLRQQGDRDRGTQRLILVPFALSRGRYTSAGNVALAPAHPYVLVPALLHQDESRGDVVGDLPIRGHIGLEYAGGGWWTESTGEVSQTALDFGRLEREMPDGYPRRGISEYHLLFNTDPELDALSRAWDRYIGQPFIPYNLDERRSVLKHAYEELAPYIERWTARLRSAPAIS